MKYFKRADRIALLSLFVLIIIGKIQKRYDFGSTATTALDVLCILVFVFTLIATGFYIRNSIRNEKKYHKHTFFVYIPYLLMAIAMIVVTLWFLA